MGLIKQMKQFITGTAIFPITKTRAVYDDNGNRLDDILSGTIVEADVLEGESNDTPRDADRLGGQLPEYYAKQNDMSKAQSDIDSISTKFAVCNDKTLELKSKTTFPHTRLRGRVNANGNPMLESYTLDENGTVNNYIATWFDGTGFSFQGIKDGGTAVTNNLFTAIGKPVTADSSAFTVSMNCRRYGNVVNLSGTITVIKALTTEVVACTLPAGFHRTNGSWVTPTARDTHGKNIYACRLTNGSLYLRGQYANISAGASVIIEACYVLDDGE